jgi:hypothetical protein
MFLVSNGDSCLLSVCIFVLEETREKPRSLIRTVEAVGLQTKLNSLKRATLSRYHDIRRVSEVILWLCICRVI